MRSCRARLSSVSAALVGQAVPERFCADACNLKLRQCWRHHGCVEAACDRSGESAFRSSFYGGLAQVK